MADEETEESEDETTANGASSYVAWRGAVARKRADEENIRWNGVNGLAACWQAIADRRRLQQLQASSAKPTLRHRSWPAKLRRRWELRSGLYC